jgi:hypothetical protein
VQNAISFSETQTKTKKFVPIAEELGKIRKEQRKRQRQIKAFGR